MYSRITSKIPPTSEVNLNPDRDSAPSHMPITSKEIEDMQQYISRFTEIDNADLESDKVKEQRALNLTIIREQATHTYEQKLEDARQRVNILLNLNEQAQGLNDKMYAQMEERVRDVWTADGRRRNLGLILLSWALLRGDIDLADEDHLLNSQMAKDFIQGYEVDGEAVSARHQY